jgi:hypothetical protein
MAPKPLQRAPYPPRIHVGGTAKVILVEGYDAAMHAVRQAQEAMRATAPHPRDYIGNRGDSERFTCARLQHQGRMDRLAQCLEELQALWEAVDTQPDNTGREP